MTTTRPIPAQPTMWLLAALLLFLTTGCGTADDPSLEPTIPLEACVLNQGIEAQCGILTVPENRSQPAGRQLDIHIAVIEATNNAQAEDPLFLLAGGPGQAAISIFPLLVPVLDDIREVRDIVLVDQRGTGQSNPLSCDDVLDVELEPLVMPTVEDIRQQGADCAAGLAEIADLTQYTTEIAAADLDAVREGLGYEIINLLGISYGTRMGMVYADLYPERVRTLILDAVTSSELVIFLQAPADAQGALDEMLTRCAADAACAQAFPDLGETLDSLLADLAAPQPVLVTHPRTGERLEILLDRELLMQLIFNLLYAPTNVSLLPLMITEAAATGDYSPLLAQALLQDAEQGLYSGMFYAVTCTEDAPYLDLGAAAELQEGTEFPLMAENLLLVCESWPRAAEASVVRAPFESDIPTLLISGTSDPITPPLYAEQVEAGLSDFGHIVLKGYGHGNSTVGCVPRILAEFVAAGTAVDLDPSCIDTIQPQPFFTDYSGPNP